MARDTWPAMLMMTSSPAPDSASSVTRVWRLSCQRPTTLALSRTFVHAVFSEVTGRVGSFGCPLPAGKTYHSGLPSPNRPMYHAACASRAIMTVSLSGITRPVPASVFDLQYVVSGALAALRRCGRVGRGGAGLRRRAAFLSLRQTAL